MYSMICRELQESLTIKSILIENMHAGIWVFFQEYVGWIFLGTFWANS
jgi:hypothetical protein